MISFHTFVVWEISLCCHYFATDFISAKVTPPNTVPSLGRPLDLACHDSRTPSPLSASQSVVWYKDGQEVRNMGQSATLHFESLLPSDSGLYQCEAMSGQETRVISRDYSLSGKYSEWQGIKLCSCTAVRMFYLL